MDIKHYLRHNKPTQVLQSLWRRGNARNGGKFTLSTQHHVSPFYLTKYDIFFSGHISLVCYGYVVMCDFHASVDKLVIAC